MVHDVCGSCPFLSVADEKVVMVSQWTSVLDVLAVHLKRRDCTFTRIDGKMQPKEKQVSAAGRGGQALWIRTT
jgi:SNF2 family DNA or RNA helicase